MFVHLIETVKSRMCTDFLLEFSISPLNAISNPGGGLGIPTDRDQQSWVFLKDQKKNFVMH